MKNTKLFNKKDLILIILLAALALGMIAPRYLNRDAVTAKIYTDGELTETIELQKVDRPYTFSPKEGTVISVEKGRIRFLSSCCRDETCVKAGWLSVSGQTSACLPQKIAIVLTGKDSPHDMMTY